MMHQLLYFDLSCDDVTIYCDNTSAISLSKYIVRHSRAKHIDIIIMLKMEILWLNLLILKIN